MSDSLEDFLGTAPAPTVPAGAEEIEGTLDCGYCLSIAHEGLYYKEKKQVQFYCPNGHLNTVNMEL